VPETLAQQPAAHPVQIARVRPVLVGSSTPEAKPVSGDADPPTTIEAVLEQWRGANPDRQDQANNAGTTMPAFAAASTSAMRLSALQPRSDKPPLMSDPMPASGAPPSTFERQAGNLARGEAAIPATVPSDQPANRPQRMAAQPASGYQIQIGAFQSVSEAERQLATVSARAAGLLGSAAPVTQQVKQGDKVLYRARYAGFEAQPAAVNICSELKRLKIECLVVKAE
jgi:D-alanyl-D-alanine carboxypeptidase